MKIRVNRSQFADAVSLASRFAPTKNVKPILGNLKLVVNGTAEMTATDLEIGLRLDVPGVHVDQPGESLLPAARLASVLGTMADEEVTIETDGDECTVRGDAAEFAMPTELVDSFPDVPKFKDGDCVEVAGNVLKDLIAKTTFAAAGTNTTKFGATTGVLIEHDGSEMGMVATDSRRLSLERGPATGEAFGKSLPILPTKALKLLESRLGNDVVKLQFGPNEAMIQTNGTMIYSRLVEGRFPQYRNILPKGHKHTFPLIVGPFMSALNQARVMTDDESKRVIFAIGGRKILMEAKGGQSGRSKVELAIDYDGKAEISFDPAQIIDLLKVLDRESTVTFEMTDEKTPAVFRHGSNGIYVVVPLVAATK